MTTQDQMNGALPGQGPSVEVEFHIEARMAVPPWIQGQLSATAATQLKSGVEGNFMGGERFEQLFRAQGTLRIGTEVHTFNGSGLRIKRQGIRKIEGFWGHCWQSALFPSGRGFGFIAYPPRPDGTASYNEGYIFEGDGALIPARVVHAPWLSKLQARDQDVTVVLESSHAAEPPSKARPSSRRSRWAARKCRRTFQCSSKRARAIDGTVRKRTE